MNGVWSSWAPLSDPSGALQNLFSQGGIHAFKSPIALSPQTQYADLTAIEADFPGYLPIGAGTYTGGLDVATGLYSFFFIGGLWAYSGSPGRPNTIYGWWLDNGSGVLLCAQSFDTPKDLLNVGDGFVLVPVVYLFNANDVIRSNYA